MLPAKMVAFEPVTKQKLSDSIVERLLSLIWNGELTLGGTMPSERELMQRFQVGRPAVREAMQNLERMGLIEIRQGERARVAVPSFDRMVSHITGSMRHLLTHSESSRHELREARVIFEVQMARIAAERRTAAQLASLRDILDAQAKLQFDLPRFLEMDGIFHREIAAISGNAIFVTLNQALFRWLVYFSIDLDGASELQVRTLAEHRRILDAIDAGDGEAATAAMQDHLDRAGVASAKSGGGQGRASLA